MREQIDVLASLFMSLEEITLPETKVTSPLDKWLWQRRLTARWLAAQIGVHEATVSRIKHGHTPSAEVGDAIRKLTGLKRL